MLAGRDVNSQAVDCNVDRGVMVTRVTPSGGVWVSGTSVEDDVCGWGEKRKRRWRWGVGVESTRYWCTAAGMRRSKAPAASSSVVAAGCVWGGGGCCGVWGE